MNAKLQDVKSVFLRIVDKHQAGPLDALLDAECGNDANLREQVKLLLQAHHVDDCLFDKGAIAAPSEMPDESHENVGAQIGPYTLRELLAEGGMGAVYVAEQTEPVRRKVALKIIKSGLATKEVVARFEAERQALAMMDHPNIARLFDGGATDSGQPLFVMELVQGLPITEYCDRKRLSTHQRLRLFVTVCEAVHHAHQKGIIHRDLKPTNVLVAEIDGKAVPKVIDFGVAKAVSDRLTQQTLYTNFSQMIGTPLYMSPEQASMGVTDVDTRSDVYSLGVLLYELLTSRTPFNSDTLKNVGFDEMRRIIRKDEPSRPSTLVSTFDLQALSTAASCRDIDPRQLTSSLRGELDWLVMKSLEKDRGRRYGSAIALAEDLDRFLTNQPITAGPPSTAYRFKKFVQRQRARLIPASIVACVLLVGLTMALVTVLRERAEKQAAWYALEDLQTKTARRLYASQMVQAVNAWEDQDYAALQDLLDRTTPQSSALPDFRDWEWNFLNEQLRRLFVSMPNNRAYGAAWNPQKNEIAVVVETSEGSSVEIWKIGDPRSRRKVADMAGTPASTIVGFQWSPRGNRLAFGTVAGRAVVLHAESGEILFDQQVHDQTHSVSLSPTADILATASRLGAIKTWDIETQQLVDVLHDPPKPDYLGCVAFSPDGAHLAATLRKGKRYVWKNLRVNNRTKYDPVDDGPNGYLAWAANGEHFATANDQTVAVYQLDKKEPTAIFQHREASSVCWLDAHRIASCGQDQTVKFFDLQQDQLIRSFRLDRAPLHHMDISSDGRYLASWGPQGLQVIRLAANPGYDNLAPIDRSIEIESDVPLIGSLILVASIVRWSEDGNQIAVKHWARPGPDYSQGRTTLCIYDVQTTKLMVSHDDIGHGHPLMFWSADGRRVHDVDHSGCRFEYDANDPDPALTTENNEISEFFDGFWHLALNQDVGLLAVAGDREVRICDPDHLQILQHRIAENIRWGVRLLWSPDNRLLLIASPVDDSIVLQVHELERHQTREFGRIVGGHDPVVTWNPTSTRVAVGVQEAVIHIRSLTSMDAGTKLIGHTAPVLEVSWAPNGNRIASCAKDGTIRIWDADRGDQLAVFHPPEEFIEFHSVQWSPDGRRLAASGTGGIVYILDAGLSSSVKLRPKPTLPGTGASD